MFIWSSFRGRGRFPTTGVATDPGPFNNQTGTFTIEWDAVPSASPIDVVMGIADGAPAGFSNMACGLRFNSSGNFDSRNGGSYIAANTVAYSGSVSYHCKLVVNISAHTYSSYVTPSGGSETQIANNYSFRTEQASVTQLNYLARLTTSGDAVLSNMIGPAAEALPPVVSDATFSLATSGSGWTTGKVVGTVTATRSPTSWSITAGNSSGYYAISNAGIITVTSTGLTALEDDTGSSSLTVQATNSYGSDTGTASINYAPEAATGLYPKSMSDPMFTGMTELNATLEAVAGNTYNNRSWLEHSTESWSVLMEDNVTFNTTRMRTREGFRYRGYANTAINYLMLEVYGIGEDHSDGVQWEGGDNHAVFNHCHFRVTSGGFTGLFAADGSTGTFSFEDCIWTCDGGGNGFVFYADAGFGTIKVSMKNCFIQQSGWGSSDFIINRTTGGTNACEVLLWENVRYCTWDHATGTLTPGSLIPQPANT